MKIIINLLFIVVLFFSFTHMVSADVAPSPQNIYFYFEKEGEPFEEVIEFVVRCYGADAIYISENIVEISKISGTCQSYGCNFETRSGILNSFGHHIEYCDIEILIDNENFTISNFLGPSMDRLKCHSNYDTSMGRPGSPEKYYKKTKSYRDCEDKIHEEYYPNGSDYICFKFLEEISEDDDYLLQRHVVINGKFFKYTNEVYSCISEHTAKQKLCDAYLEDVTSKIDRDSDGNPFGTTCEIKIEIPEANFSEQNNISPSEEQDLNNNIFTRFFNSIKCFFLRLFNRNCQ